MHFRILKIIATSGLLTALECTKFVFARGSPKPCWGSLQRSPDPLTGLRGLLLRGRGWKREGRGGERGRGGNSTGKEGKEGRVEAGPLCKFLDPSLVSLCNINSTSLPFSKFNKLMLFLFKCWTVMSFFDTSFKFVCTIIPTVNNVLNAQRHRS